MVDSHPIAAPDSGALYTSEARAQYEDARAAALAAFAQNGRVEALWRALAKAMDRLLAAAALDRRLTLVAVGGYGRAEMFPYSDVDVLVLMPPGAAMEDAVVPLMQELWALHGAVSHATRTVDEAIAAAQGDHTIAASMLDARYVAGDKPQFAAFEQRFAQEVAGQQMHRFVTAKLEERDRRHAKWGDSRFMLEPQVKEGKGALRDLQTLRWLSHYCYGTAQAEALLTRAEWKHWTKAYHFFASVRAQMHVLRGRADERLTFDLQTEIAARLKFRGANAQQKAERLMQRYFQHAQETGALTRIFCAGLDAAKLRPEMHVAQHPLQHRLPEGLVLDQGRVNLARDDAFLETPTLAVQLFAAASAQGLAVHSHAYLALARALPMLRRKLRKDAAAQALLLGVMLGKTPELYLRWMNEAGVLGALVPEFARVGGMMQYDGYHTYTVDEHSLVAIGNLAQIEQGAWAEDFPLASRVVGEISDRATLYVAVLCHDLAKGTGGDHANKGAVLVTQIGKRLGLNAAQQNLAAWLVRHQELMSETAFKRDLDDPATLADFVEIVQSPERLRLLLLLTVSDIKAVGPAIWNGWKGALVRDLYARALARMGVVLPRGGHPVDDSETALESLPDAAQHVVAAWRAAPQQPVLVITHDRFRAISEITCCMTFTPQGLRCFAGVLAYLGASIVTARCVQMGKAALMTIGIQDVAGNSFADEDARLAALQPLLAQAMAGQLDFARELPKRRRLGRGREVAIAPAVFIDNAVSATATVVEVNARDRIGLFYDILGGIEACQLQIVSAQLATYGSKAVDVFYVKDAYGHKLTHPKRLQELQRSVLAVCGESKQDAKR